MLVDPIPRAADNQVLIVGDENRPQTLYEDESTIATGRQTVYASKLLSCPGVNKVSFLLHLDKADPINIS